MSRQSRGAVRHGDRQGGRDAGHLEAEVGFVCGLRVAENGQGRVPTAGWAPGVVWVPLLGLVPLLDGDCRGLHRRPTIRPEPLLHRMSGPPARLRPGWPRPLSD